MFVFSVYFTGCKINAVHLTPPPGVLPDIEHFFGINDEKSGLLQTGKKTKLVS